MGIVEEDIQDQLSKLEKDHEDLKVSLQANCSDKVALEQEYSRDADAALQQFEVDVSRIRENVQLKLDNIPEDQEQRILLCKQREAAMIAAAYSAYHQDLMKAYRACMAKSFTACKIEEELRSIRQRKQQEIEGMESAIDAKMYADTEKLIAVHHAKYDEAISKRLECEGATEGLQARFDAIHKGNKDRLDQRRAKRRQGRAKELIALGARQSDADEQADKELTDFEMKENEVSHERLEEFEKAMITDPLENKLEEVKKAHVSCCEALDVGLSAIEKRRRGTLEERIEKRRRAKAKELMVSNNNLNEEVALSEADRILEDDIKAEYEKLDQQIKDDRSRVIAIIDKEATDDLARVESAHRESKLSKEDYIEEKKRIEFEDKLARAMLESGLEGTRTKYKKKLLQKRAALKKRAAQNIKQDNPDITEEELDTQSDAQADKESNVLVVSMERDMIAAQLRLKSVVEASYDDDVQTIKAEHTMLVEGLENGLAAASDHRKKHLRQRLQKRRDIVRDSLRNRGKTDEEATAIASAELDTEMNKFDDIVQAEEDDFRRKHALLSAEAQGKLEIWNEEDQQMAAREEADIRFLREEAKKFNDSMVMGEGTAAARALVTARTVAKKSQDEADIQLKEIRERHNIQREHLKESIEQRKVDDMNHLKKRLEEKKRRRKAELISNEGKSEAEAEVAAEIETRVDEEETMTSIESQYNTEIATAMKEKDIEMHAEENELLTNMLGSASRERDNKMRDRDMAAVNLARIKRENEEEAVRVQDVLNAKRQSREEDLKKRLAAKKAKKMEEMEKKGLSDKKAAEEAEEFARQEEAELAALRKKEDEEELAERQRVQRESQEAEEKAAEEARKKHEEAAAAAAKVAALKTAKDLEASEALDAHARELKRLRDSHEKEKNKVNSALNQDKKSKAGKLADRLKAKREKKARELEANEIKAMKELEEKQAKEKEDLESAGVARDAWLKAFEVADTMAKEQGLIGKEREDILLRATLGQQLVPQKQLTECVEYIMKDRHTDETAGLLHNHYLARVEMIRPAIESLLAERNPERSAIIKDLTENGADETEMKRRIAEFDDQFAVKQRAAEEAAITPLEPQHMKEQMELKQRQLQDISRAIMTYSRDGDASAAAAGASEETIMEEMAAYRANLEKEKQDREKLMLSEREEQERAIRESHEKQLADMQAALKEEQSKQEEKLAAAKVKMAERAAAKSREVEETEKARIMESFNKEASAAKDAAEAARKAKKSRLQERLAKRRLHLK